MHFCASTCQPSIEYGRECYCGFEFLLKTTAKAADCNMACSGDSAQACGGPNRLSAFANGAPGPVANLGVNSFVFKGCWSDSVQARTLSHTVRTQGDSGGLSIAACTSACKGQGFIYSGVEYGRGRSYLLVIKFTLHILALGTSSGSCR